MPQTRIILDASEGIPELQVHKDSIAVARAIPVIAAMPQGMTNGHPSVMLFVELPDKKIVCAETSLKLFLTVATAFKARYGHPDDEGPPRIENMPLGLALDAMESFINAFPVQELRTLVMRGEANMEAGEQVKCPSGRSVSANTRRARIFLDFFDELERWQKEEM